MNVQPQVGPLAVGVHGRVMATLGAVMGSPLQCPPPLQQPLQPAGQVLQTGVTVSQPMSAATTTTVVTASQLIAGVPAVTAVPPVPRSVSDICQCFHGTYYLCYAWSGFRLWHINCDICECDPVAQGASLPTRNPATLTSVLLPHFLTKEWSA